MNHEFEILSEFIDGELPADLHRRVEARIQHDEHFRRAYDVLLTLRRRLHETGGSGEQQSEVLRASKERVWQLIERDTNRTNPRFSWLHRLSGILSHRVSLPVPALAALLVVFVSLGLASILRNADPSGGQGGVVADTSLNGTGFTFDLSQDDEGLPSNLVSTGVPVATISPDVNGLPVNDGMSVTIEVQNMRQLLSILESNHGFRDVTIQLPQIQPVETIGEPVLLRRSDIENPAEGNR